jgi:hypothetical protein
MEECGKNTDSWDWTLLFSNETHIRVQQAVDSFSQPKTAIARVEVDVM